MVGLEGVTAYILVGCLRLAALVTKIDWINFEQHVFMLARRVSYREVANNIVPDDLLNLRPADYEARLASHETH